jgi:hypothetical protein
MLTGSRNPFYHIETPAANTYLYISCMCQLATRYGMLK